MFLDGWGTGVDGGGGQALMGGGSPPILDSPELKKARTLFAEIIENCGSFLDCGKLFTLIMERNLNFFLNIKYLEYLYPINVDFNNNSNCLWKF